MIVTKNKIEPTEILIEKMFLSVLVYNWTDKTVIYLNCTSFIKSLNDNYVNLHPNRVKNNF